MKNLGKNESKVKIEAKVSPSIEGIQLCLANAERIYYDAIQMESPASDGLVVISIEETMKAYSMFLSVVAKKNPQEPIRQFYELLNSNKELTMAEISKITDFLQNKGNELFNGMTVSGFNDHSYKLDYLRTLIEFLKVTLSIRDKLLDVSKIWKMSVGTIVTPQKRRIASGTREIINFLKTVNTKTIVNSLLRVRERSFYVEYDGTFIFPFKHTIMSDMIEDLALLLISFLKADLHALFGTYKT